MMNFDPSPPTPLETTVQKETLDDLRNGVIPDRYELSGYLCKKGQKLIFLEDRWSAIAPTLLKPKLLRWAGFKTNRKT